MSISKLYLFSKNTDAPFAARGFEYQKMQTLATWLDNYLRQVDEVIYCDYEEDIFQRDEQNRVARFRQVKLYSTNFSFRDEEVQKAVAHFFMLHVKSDYQDWNKQFVFEASSRVAAVRGNNEAGLFRQWVANQENLPPDLLAQCAAKVQEFVTAYVEQQARRLADREDSATVAEALAVLAQLGKEEWQQFARCIRWEFAEADTPEAAFAAAHARVQQLLGQLPANLPEAQQRALEGILFEEVSLKIKGTTPAERALTLAELEHHLLASGTEQERWYLGLYEKWKALAPTGELRPGEMLEISSAANYCRWTASLAGHTQFWLGWLRSYIGHRRALPGLRRSAVYEYLFLRMRPASPFDPPQGTMAGDEAYVRDYLQGLADLRNSFDLENAQSLLFLTVAAYRLRRTGLSKAEILNWLSQFGAALEQAVAAAPTPSGRCRLLECQLTNQFFNLRPHNAAAKMEGMRPLAAELLRYLPGAAHYNVTHLSEKLHQYQLILLKAHFSEYAPLLDELDELTQKLEPYVRERSGANQRARKLVEQGAEYLRHDTPASQLLALHKFHGAKDLWNNKEAIEGFVLALFQLAHLYQGLGLSLAAKYCALGAAWACEHSDGGQLLVREPEALALVFQADFQQGAWLSASAGFDTYLRTRYQLNPQPISIKEEPALLHAVAEYALMLFAAPQVAPAVGPMLHQQRSSLPTEIRTQGIDPSMEAYKAAVPVDELPRLLARKLTDQPLSDAGRQRTLTFRALGSTWTLRFANTYRLVPVAEEFAARLQILLAEVALSAVDFHLPKGQVELQLLEAAKGRKPKRLPANSRYAWEIVLRHSNKSDSDQINRAAARVSDALLTILGEMSLLPAAEFSAGYISLFEKNGLATKSFFANAYQRMYRYFLPHKKFTGLQHQRYQPAGALPTAPVESPAMQWKSSLSAKYDPVRASRHVRERFVNSTRCIFLTLQRLQQTDGYDAWLRQLREAGWPDWQLVAAMGNYVLDTKVRRLLAARPFTSEARYVQAMQQTFERLHQLSEADCYLSLSLADFQGEQFQEQLRLGTFYTLRSYGLEDVGKAPYFEAIREFLQIRFRSEELSSEVDNPLVVRHQADPAVIRRAIERDWVPAVAVRFMPGDEARNQPAVVVLTFRQSTQGQAGYELLLDFYHAQAATLAITVTGNTLQLLLEDQHPDAAITLGGLDYAPEELAAFLAQPPIAAGFVFAIGTPENDGRSLIATRTPYAPFVVRSYSCT